MCRHFFNTLSRFRTSSVLNILGLASAYVALTVIGLQVIAEYSYDSNYPDSDRIYRIERPDWNDKTRWGVAFSRPVIDAIVSSSPDVEESSIIRLRYVYSDTGNWKVEGIEDDKGLMRNIGLVGISGDFPKMFGMRIVEGDSLSQDRGHVLIPHSLARQVFGDKSAVGQFIKSADGRGNSYMINGVYEDFPSTSSFPNRFYYNVMDEEVGYSNYTSFVLFVKLRKGADVAAFEEQMCKTVNEMYSSGDPWKIRASKFSDRYFASDLNDSLKSGGNIEKTRLFCFIVLFIILIASINYINFAMALVPIRIRSLNTRKIFGATNLSLRSGLIVEAIGISLIAYILAVGVLINFDTLDGISFITQTVYVADNFIPIIGVGVFAVVLGVLAGIYPAFYSTSFRAAYVLKGSFSMSPRGRILRSALVGFQFVISIGLIVASMFMNLQFSMILNQDIGIDKENIIQLNATGKLGDMTTDLCSKISSLSGVKDVTYMPGFGGFVSDQYANYTFGPNEEIRLDNIHGRSNICDFFDVKIVEGRSFTKEDDQRKPNSSVIINKAAQQKYNLKVGDRLGRFRSVYDGYMFDSDSTSWEVIGVAEDYNFKPLYETPTPLAFFNYGTAKSSTIVYIKAQTGDYPTLIAGITAAAKEIDPDWVSEVSFFDERIERLYEADLRSASLVSWFSLLAIVISLVGVFGLAHFEVRYRRKEIGLRKINGAMITQILSLFSRKFVLMTFVCYLIAAPVAAYFVNDWLKVFAYRTPFHWWVFALALIIVLVIVLLTVIVQSYRAAVENPVNSIKAE